MSTLLGQRFAINDQALEKGQLRYHNRRTVETGVSKHAGCHRKRNEQLIINSQLTDN